MYQSHLSWWEEEVPLTVSWISSHLLSYFPTEMFTQIISKKDKKRTEGWLCSFYFESMQRSSKIHVLDVKSMINIKKKWICFYCIICLFFHILSESGIFNSRRHFHWNLLKTGKHVLKIFYSLSIFSCSVSVVKRMEEKEGISSKHQMKRVAVGQQLLVADDLVPAFVEFAG